MNEPTHPPPRPPRRDSSDERVFVIRRTLRRMGLIAGLVLALVGGAAIGYFVGRNTTSNTKAVRATYHPPTSGPASSIPQTTVPATTTTAPLSTTPPSITTTAPPPTTSAVPPDLVINGTSGGFDGIEPVTIYFSGTRLNFVTDLSWGSGTWYLNNNGPAGPAIPYPATIILSNPVNGMFTSIVETTSGPAGSTGTYTYGGVWPAGASYDPVDLNSP